MALLAVAGQTGTRQTAHLLYTILSGTVGVRAGLITPEYAWLNGRSLPAPAPVSGRIPALLATMAASHCTHVILCPSQQELADGQLANLRFSVTAPIGPMAHPHILPQLLSQSDICVLDLDECRPQTPFVFDHNRIFTYSENKACADLTARNLRLFPGHTEFEAITTGQIQRIHLPVCGGFSVYHALCVLSCGLCLGLTLEHMARIMPAARGPAGCLEVLPIPTAYTVLLDQAEDLHRLECTLTTARSFTARQLVCLLDGKSSQSMTELAHHLADRVVAFGTTRADRCQAIVRGLDRARPGDVLVLTGTDGGTEERAFIRACAHNCALRRRQTT